MLYLLPSLEFWDLVAIVTYTLAVAVISGIVIGTRTRSPLLAAMAGGPTAVTALYGSVVVIGLIFKGPDDVSSVDWWALAALLTYPATPAFVIGVVAACVTSLFRTSLASKHP